MRKVRTFQLVIMSALLLFGPSCSDVAITGRKQFNLVPDSLMNSMSFQQYSQFISQNKLSSDAGDSGMVKEVGIRIQKAVERYYAENNMSDELAGYQWEFNLVEDPAVNAWAMPGGKVVVYSGLLPVARDQAGLAVVLSHEIAHATARHGGERMTQGLMVEMGGMALSQALSGYPDQTKNLFLKSYGVGTQVGVLLPYSRVQESEADHLGLVFMAMAGYDPNAAIDFWERMAAAKQGKDQPLEILSTHPADTTRVNNIRRLIPEVMQYYRPSSRQVTSSVRRAASGRPWAFFLAGGVFPPRTVLSGSSGCR